MICNDERKISSEEFFFLVGLAFSTFFIKRMSDSEGEEVEVDDQNAVDNGRSVRDCQIMEKSVVHVLLFERNNFRIYQAHLSEK